ncbi:MAG: hypothetical protein ACSLE6_14930 [Mycobacterium sp.]
MAAKPDGGPGEPDWLSYQLSDRASPMIDKDDAVINDADGAAGRGQA